MRIATTLKVVTARHLARIGLVLRDESLKRGTLVGDLDALLRDRGITTVLDIGANIGQFAKTVRSEIGFKGTIISFEPSQEAYASLLTVEDEDWQRYAIALGETETEAEFFHYPIDQFNSFHQPSAWGHLNWDLESSGSTVVDVRRLDKFAAEHELEAESTFLKVDTQGHDLNVLRGAGDFAKRCAGLLLEMPAMNIYEDVPMLHELWVFVRSLGFEPVGLYPVQRWLKDDLLVLEFDGLFARPM